jgi:hypothetical protein
VIGHRRERLVSALLWMVARCALAEQVHQRSGCRGLRQSRSRLSLLHREEAAMTFKLSPSSPAPDGYYDRKGREQCVYDGCPDPCDDECVMCPRHGLDHRKRNRVSMRNRRRYRRVQLWLLT